MPHRDPQSGQFVADSDDDHGLSYSDHDVHHVTHRLFGSSSGSVNPDPFDDTRRFEITERGLDPDEIAELRAMRLHVGQQMTHDGSDEGPTDVTYTMNTGYNLGSGEFLGNENLEDFDIDNDSATEYTVITGDTDEVGELYSATGTLTAPFDDSTNGSGGGSTAVDRDFVMPLSDMFGSGPFVDSADDFVSRIRLNPNRLNGSVGLKLTYSLYYNVLKTEGGRSRFGR